MRLLTLIADTIRTRRLLAPDALNKLTGLVGVSRSPDRRACSQCIEGERDYCSSSFFVALSRSTFTSCIPGRGESPLPGHVKGLRRSSLSCNGVDSPGGYP